MGSCVTKKVRITDSHTPCSEMRQKMKEHIRFLSNKGEITPRLSISGSTIYKRRHLSQGSIPIERSESDVKNE